MHIELWSIGKTGEAYAEEGSKMYIKRLQHYTDFSFRLIPPLKNSGNHPVATMKKQEGKMILSLLDNSDHLIALDEKGKLLTTLQLSDFISRQMTMSARRLVFLIGGAFGLDEAVISRANTVLSLSPLTFPHQLVRLIMAEQLYRVFTILHNEQYHHQ